MIGMDGTQGSVVEELDIPQEMMRCAYRAEALLRTPYLHQGRDPTIGIDCAGLAILAVGERAIRAIPEPRYTRQQTGAVLRRMLHEFCTECQLVPGALASLVVGREVKHLGVVDSTGVKLIHVEVGRGVREWPIERARRLVSGWWRWRY